MAEPEAPPPPAPADSVSDRLAIQIEQIVLKRIAAGSLSLPTLPFVANKIFEALGDPQFGARHADDLLQIDPILCARVLQKASAPALGKPRKHTLGDAISRLGVRAARTVLYESAMSQLNPSREPKINDAVRGLWAHSVAVSRLARDLSALSNLGDPDLAMLAALLHDLGKPVVATVLIEAEKQLTRTSKRTWISGSDWVAVVEKVHRKVGVALAEQWGLPEVLLKSIRDCSEYDNSDRASPSNVVCLANALAKREGLAIGTIDRDDVDAIVMIGRSLMGVTDELLGKVTAGIREKADIF